MNASPRADLRRQVRHMSIHAGFRCLTCDGTGWTTKTDLTVDPCRACGGSGFHRARSPRLAPDPAGVGRARKVLAEARRQTS